MQLTNRIREAVTAFLDPRETMYNRQFRQDVNDACLKDAMKRALDEPVSNSHVRGYVYQEFSRVEIYDAIEKKQRESQV